MEVQKFSYDNKVVKYFAYATVIWGIIGMLVGLIAALQLAFPEFFNEYLNYASGHAETYGKNLDD